MTLQNMIVAIDRWRADLERAVTDNKPIFAHIAELYADTDDPGDPADHPLTEEQVDRLFAAGESMYEAIEAIVVTLNELKE